MCSSAVAVLRPQTWFFKKYNYLKNYFSFNVYRYFACVYYAHATSASREKKRISGPLRQLQTVTSYQVDARNQTLVLWKSSQCALHHQAISPH